MKEIFSNVAKKIINILDEDHSCTEIEYMQMLYRIHVFWYAADHCRRISLQQH